MPRSTRCPASSVTCTLLNAGSRSCVNHRVTIGGEVGTELQIGLKSLPPGTYTVSWHVVSVDTHPTEGTFTFEVGTG